LTPYCTQAWTKYRTFVPDLSGVSWWNVSGSTAEVMAITAGLRVKRGAPRAALSQSLRKGPKRRGVNGRVTQQREGQFDRAWRPHSGARTGLFRSDTDSHINHENCRFQDYTPVNIGPPIFSRKRSRQTFQLIQIWPIEFGNNGVMPVHVPALSIYCIFPILNVDFHSSGALGLAGPTGPWLGGARFPVEMKRRWKVPSGVRTHANI
jgi:hypothetical protein